MTTPDALDKLDKAILRCLQKNGRETYDVIGAAIGLSPSAVLRRVKRLEQLGIIKGYRAEIDRRAIGLGVLAFVRVDAERNRMGGDPLHPLWLDVGGDGPVGAGRD